MLNLFYRLHQFLVFSVCESDCISLKQSILGTPNLDYFDMPRCIWSLHKQSIALLAGPNQISKVLARAPRPTTHANSEQKLCGRRKPSKGQCGCERGPRCWWWAPSRSRRPRAPGSPRSPARRPANPNPITPTRSGKPTGWQKGKRKP